MPPVGAFLRAATLGSLGGALVSARNAWCAPVLPPAPTGASDELTVDAIAGMRLQDQSTLWDIELDEFGGGYRADTAQLQILRLRAEYADSTGATAPVMRIVGFFPAVATSTVHDHLTNVELRRRWDANYTHFARFDGTRPPVVLESVPTVRRPLAAVARRRPQCSGDVCTLVPDVSTAALDDGWFCHRVGGALLRRFGLADRLFQYERISFVHRFDGGRADTAETGGGAAAMYDVLFCGSKRARAAATSMAPPLGAWLQENRSASPCEEVDVNFQHVVLIPIADAAEQLFADAAQLRRLCTMGSLLDETSSKLVYSVFKDTTERAARGAAPQPGTLLVMTSANKVGVPPLLPRWVQATVSSTMSRKAYGRLLEECVLRESLAAPRVE
ncbi:hypothetical protein NESM_000072200 [Novymonas esmeraldas]|uniref:START domain-containing protein n=1 Tax=Novymonas esmeraldas TaxID=1808958 RepID=A0AAW0F4Y1_9TRYP